MQPNEPQEPVIRVSLIVARAENGVIGKDGKLPWHISADLQYFKRLTLGKPVVMGRKTYESIGKPLPRRTNIVVTRDSDWRAEGVLVANDVPSALALAYEDAHRTGVDEIMIIGGAEIFNRVMDSADRLYLTEVHRDYEGETVMALDRSTWREKARSRHTGADPSQPDFSFVTLDRVRG